ncbi:MAG: thioesterase family protein [Pseudomonadota bacterium]
MDDFTASFQVTWADLDGNNHMRNTGYLDYAAQTRMIFFASHGFTPDAFTAHNVGPVALEDTVSYLRELRLLDVFRVSFALAGMSENGAKFMLENQIKREDGKLCATVRTRGIWMDLRARKAVAPPEALFQAMQTLTKTKDFDNLP